MHGYADDRPCDRCAPTADERRVEVAAKADDAHYIVGFGMETRCICGEWSYYPDESSFDLHRVRAVVAALDAHDGDLRERLAGVAAEAIRLHDVEIPKARERAEANLRVRLATAIEALAFPPPTAPLIDTLAHGIEAAARIVRETP